MHTSGIAPVESVSTCLKQRDRWIEYLTGAAVGEAYPEYYHLDVSYRPDVPPALAATPPATVPVCCVGFGFRETEAAANGPARANGAG